MNVGESEATKSINFRVKKEMNRRSGGGGSCIAIRTVPSISSRFYHASASFAGSGRGKMCVYLTSIQRIKRLFPWRPPARARFKDPATCGAPTWMRKGLPCVCFKRKGNYARICMNVTPLQEERLRRLKNRTKTYFDANRLEHQEALRALWSSTFPDQELLGLISDQWKKMGWQGKDPSTDFRGAGFISLENLLFFAKTYSISFQQLLRKQGSKGAAWEYPFAVAGVNITFMLMKLLDLDTTKPRTLVSAVFVHMLSENEWAFDLLYCVAFVVMDKKWNEKNASYMEFNDVLKSTRAQLEKELLMDDVLRIEDMPSFRLLC